MTTKTITSVVEEIEDWQSRYGDIMYSVVAFAGVETIKANKKSHDAALELQGLLKEAMGTPQEFALSEDGTSKAGNPKWKLLAFGPVDGPLTYSTLKEGKVPGTGIDTPRSATRPRSPDDQDGMRHGVAMKAAAIFMQGGTFNDLERAYRFIDALLLEPSTGPSLPAETAEGVLSNDPSTPSATTSPAEVAAEASPGAPMGDAEQASAGGTTSVSADDRGGQEFGEGSCPPHQLNLDVAAKAGRYPCRKCDAWINPRGGFTE